MDQLQHLVLSYLPPQIQELVLNPPNLNDPASLLSALRVVFPLAKYAIIILAFYIVWSTIAGVVGYFSRFMRFALRIGPIVGIVGWLMANSGQGSMQELLELVKQWTGLASPRGNPSPGIASLAGLFNAGGQGAGSRYASKNEPISSRTRSGRKSKNDNDEFLFSMLKSAASLGQNGQGGDWQEVVQDYVKRALAKASGLEWLLGQGGEDEARRRRR